MNQVEKLPVMMDDSSEVVELRGYSMVSHYTTTKKALGSIVYGWLWKQGSNVKSWKKRFFVLRGRLLEYYDQCTIMESKRRSSGEMKIFTAQAKGNLYLGHAEISQHTPFGILIFTTKGKRMYLNAGNYSDREQWMQAFASAAKKKLVAISQSSGLSPQRDQSICSFISTDSPSNSMYAMDSPVEFIQRVKEGYLVKQGSQFHSWKRRYFVYRNGILLYKENHNADTSTINCAQVTKVTLTDDKKFGICIRFGESRNLLVRALDEQERMDWFEVLTSHLTEKVE